MHPECMKAVKNWSRPESHKQLQQFLGFVNFYLQFIRNYSSVAAPLFCLTSTLLSFSWTPEADQAFLKLKELFTSAPSCPCNPTQQFIVEVDASNLGVGVVLSQRNCGDNRLHPCAFFLHRLTLAEQNYAAGERELLGIKLALQEWRHWLQGAELPIIVWTDHKNLEYLQTVKRLNPHQDHWALFFGMFRFALSYHPGAKNGKPDALSH
ncbi:hypothetical protein QTP86_001125 [Hemibagrus guttatus]|nr:hypothetical protein QTP86_001125 [Hemibagrus guttatus]